LRWILDHGISFRKPESYRGHYVLSEVHGYVEQEDEQPNPTGSAKSFAEERF